jgi:selenide,water dikinase
MEFFEKDVTFAPTIPDDRRWLLWDPQTSGGLLMAIPAARLADFQHLCAERGQMAWVIGAVTSGYGLEVLP